VWSRALVTPPALLARNAAQMDAGASARDRGLEDEDAVPFVNNVSHVFILIF